LFPEKKRVLGGRGKGAGLLVLKNRAPTSKFPLQSVLTPVFAQQELRDPPEDLGGGLQVRKGKKRQDHDQNLRRKINKKGVYVELAARRSCNLKGNWGGWASQGRNTKEVSIVRLRFNKELTYIQFQGKKEEGKGRKELGDWGTIQGEKKTLLTEGIRRRSLVRGKRESSGWGPSEGGEAN